MEIRFHLDEDAEEHALIFALRERGLNITSATEAHLNGGDDEFQLTWAAQNQRAIVTHNAADFCRLHKKWLETDQHHSGIVILQQQRFSVGELARRFLRLSAALDSEAMRNRLEFLSHW